MSPSSFASSTAFSGPREANPHGYRNRIRRDAERRRHHQLPSVGRHRTPRVLPADPRLDRRRLTLDPERLGWDNRTTFSLNISNPSPASTSCSTARITCTVRDGQRARIVESSPTTRERRRSADAGARRTSAHAIRGGGRLQAVARLIAPTVSATNRRVNYFTRDVGSSQEPAQLALANRRFAELAGRVRTC